MHAKQPEKSTHYSVKLKIACFLISPSCFKAVSYWFGETNTNIYSTSSSLSRGHTLCLDETDNSSISSVHIKIAIAIILKVMERQNSGCCYELWLMVKRACCGR